MGIPLIDFFKFIKDKWSVALIAGLLIFAFVQSLETIEPERFNEVILQKIEDTKELPWYQRMFKIGIPIWQWSFTMNALNPAWRFNSPFWEGYIVPLNDIPYPDSSDFFILFIFIIPPLWFVKRKFRQNKQFNYRFKLITIYIIWIIIAWFITKRIYFELYLDAATNLGFSVQEAIATREAHLEAIEGANTMLLFVSILGSIAIIDIFKKKKK